MTTLISLISNNQEVQRLSIFLSRIIHSTCVQISWDTCLSMLKGLGIERKEIYIFKLQTLISNCMKETL